MDVPSTFHPPDQILHDYGLGRLGDPAAAAVDKHLEECTVCRRRVAELSGEGAPGRSSNAQALPKTPASVRVGSSAGESRPALGASAVDPDPALAATLPRELAEQSQYLVVRELGRGGMGVVYLARNTLMDRLEVLKVLNKEMLDRKGTLDRFLREIRSAARLNHPNVVGAHSALQLGELLVFAMEYVDGYDLSKLVKSRGALPLAHACSFIHQAALGLQHAHERGMVHRDIKPENLMLTRQGQRGIVKILDFGLAKATSENPIDGGLTREGQMLGTPLYIAPEQTLDAQKADIRADIYSLGCTLYYLLSGGPPFQGKSLFDILQSHHSVDARPLNLVRPEVPWELAAVVVKMMAKDPGQRFPEPVEVARALAPFFKPGGSGSGSTDGERSQAGQPTGGSSSSGVVPAPVESSPSVDIVNPAASKRSEPGVPWESLIAIREPELGSEASAVSAPQRSRPTWVGPVLVAGLFLFAFVVAWGTGVFKPRTEAVPLDSSSASRPDENGPHSAAAKSGAGPSTKSAEALARSAHEKLVKDFAGETIDSAFPSKPTTAPASPAPAPATTFDGFQPLFNGKDLQGWKLQSPGAGSWKVEDGILVGRGIARFQSNLFTSRGDYENFHARIEAQINVNGVSGFGFRSSYFDRGPIARNGYRVHFEGMSGNHSTGMLAAAKKKFAFKEAPIQPGDWFLLEVIAVANRITVKFNGKTTVDDFDQSRTHTRGYLTLAVQDAKTEVRVRKVDVKELGSSATPSAFAETAKTLIPSGGFNQAVSVSAKKEYGYVVGKIMKGERIVLQYISGTWKGWGKYATSCPDDPVLERGNVCRLALCEAPDKGGSRVLAVVPAGTREKPFEWVADKDYGRIVLRINDNDNDYTSNPDNGVSYRLRIVAPGRFSSGSTR